MNLMTRDAIVMLACILIGAASFWHDMTEEDKSPFECTTDTECMADLARA